MSFNRFSKPITFGLFAALALLAVYFIAVGVITELPYAWSQFAKYWPFIVGLAVGFGIQIGLYSHLRQEVRNMHMKAPGRTVAITGTASTVAMISCCAHYLANIIPVLGIAGALSVVGQYQTELFWVGLTFNFIGILYIGNKVIQFRKQTQLSS